MPCVALGFPKRARFFTRSSFHAHPNPRPPFGRGNSPRLVNHPAPLEGEDWGEEAARNPERLWRGHDEDARDGLDTRQCSRCTQFLHGGLSSGGTDPGGEGDHLRPDRSLAWTSQRRQSRRLCAACLTHWLGHSLATGDQCSWARQLTLRSALRGNPAGAARSGGDSVRYVRNRRSPEVRLARASSD
jgi:hypothetical protein